MTDLSHHTLILASTSPYRRRLLERLEIAFSCIAPETDETPLPGEAPDALARRLGDAKALAVSAQFPDSYVLGSDQVASLSSAILGKPGSIVKAEEQLRRCSGQSVRFFTAVSLAHQGVTIASRCVVTRVRFRTLSDAEVADYVRREEPLDCAGSFRWEGLGICLFTALESDDPTALEGLPLIATCDMLKSTNINILKTTI
ncbi:nucleoside triphosphate pyrophosphatase [Congregibacter variabilis]|uniref:7-methyl-GTP pyrophosphatase n=1 Tax=Congregibacter variabilis TaxID=3081200 RepID=A0ABZ0I5R4_9GAMM|nr:nucleoside triphosphate pyrophosphatase [Congregibacter sp. IMCC43200]